MKVVHVITGLEQGGAEGLLARLVLHIAGRVTQSVVSLGGPGVWAKPLTDSGIAVHCIGMSRTGVNPLDWRRVIRVLRDEKAQVIQTWMYHADLVGGIAARINGAGAVAWGIRNLTLPRATSRLSTRFVRRLCAGLSASVPDTIVCNSEAAAEHHRELGYASRKMVVIPNGIDTSEFRPDPESRARLRAEWQIEDSTPVIGMVARWDPQKDHATLFHALSRLEADRVPLHCVLVGPGIGRDNPNLMRLVDSARASKTVSLLGPRDDVPAILNAIDLHVLSSRGESFPNVIAEAMACGTPCVTTDVGDAARIVGDTGIVVRPAEPVELAAGISRALHNLRSGSQRTACRQRIEKHFGLRAMGGAYLAVWQRIAAGRLA